MKVRSGFVSNSSTSSFTIYGTSEYRVEDYIEMLRRIQAHNPEHYKTQILKFIRNFSLSQAEVNAFLNINDESVFSEVRNRGCSHPLLTPDDKFCTRCGVASYISTPLVNRNVINTIIEDAVRDDGLLECLTGLITQDTEYCVYLGRKYTSMKDEETLGAFKKNIHEMVKLIIGKEVKCEHQEVIYAC
ncbi:MAG: hypothetical protein WC375_04005 [Methanomassiliicoccales archaeon]|jgi:hypothetical protein